MGEDVLFFVTSRTAQYSCKYNVEGYVETHEPTREISVTHLAKATPEEIEAKFRIAAEGMRQQIFGCYNVRFERFLTSAPLLVEPKPLPEKAAEQKPAEVKIPRLLNTRWK